MEFSLETTGNTALPIDLHRHTNACGIRVVFCGTPPSFIQFLFSLFEFLTPLVTVLFNTESIVLSLSLSLSILSITLLIFLCHITHIVYSKRPIYMIKRKLESIGPHLIKVQWSKLNLTFKFLWSLDFTQITFRNLGKHFLKSFLGFFLSKAFMLWVFQNILNILRFLTILNAVKIKSYYIKLNFILIKLKVFKFGTF